MNIFDNVNLLNEGEQAEEYKAKKAAEELGWKQKDLDEINGKRSNAGRRMTDYNPESKKETDDGDYTDKVYDQTHSDSLRRQKAMSMAHKSDKPASKDVWENIHQQAEYIRAKDAANRNIRRHSKNYDRDLNESSIFRTVIFLNEGLFSKKKQDNPIMMTDPVVKELSHKIENYVDSKIDKSKYDISKSDPIIYDNTEVWGITIYEKAYNHGKEDEYSEAEYNKLMNEIDKLYDKSISWLKSIGAKDDGKYSLNYKTDNISIEVDTHQLSLSISIIFHK